MSSGGSTSKGATHRDAQHSQTTEVDPISGTVNAEGCIPLLVKLPDGERRQVDFPPNSSIRDLKVHIASLTGDISSKCGDLNSTINTNGTHQPQGIPWDLDFAGSVLNENHTLEHYHIPDAYDHANGLLKTICDSGYDHPDKKVEAVDKALTLVRGISRGERDMERLILSVYEDSQSDTNNFLGSPTAQPSLNSMRRTRRSRIPSINLSQLPAFGSTIGSKGGSKERSGLPSAPPTPSQLIRRLSNFRPDLYDPKVIEKATSNAYKIDAHAASAGQVPNETTCRTTVSTEHGHNQVTLTGTGEVLKPSEIGAAKHVQSSDYAARSVTAIVDGVRNGMRTGSRLAASNMADASPGEDLKRGNTWFADFVSSIEHSTETKNQHDCEAAADSEEVDGDSEDDNEQSKDFRDQRHDPTCSLQNGHEVPKFLNNADVSGGSNSPSIAAKEENPTTLGSEHSVAVTSGVKLETWSGDKIENEKGDSGSKSADDMKDCPTEAVATNAKVSTENEGSTCVTGSIQMQVIGLEPELSTTVPHDQTKVAKKRGRKRKNPHLTEEERKAQRQAQNRESAKMSRIRRKNMTIEYEKRVTTLEGENENLRDTVAALTGRLEMLQNLLTISVQRRTVSNDVIAEFASSTQHFQSQAPVGNHSVHQGQAKAFSSPPTTAAASPGRSNNGQTDWIPLEESKQSLEDPTLPMTD